MVAALGERVTPPWWRTQFLTDAGLRAISRILPRTAASAAVRSACVAACSEHDRLIGVGMRYHLFRLPAELEQVIDSHLSDPAREAALSALLKGGTDYLIGELQRLAGERVASAGEGPVSVGSADHLLTGRAVAEFAAHYGASFAKAQHRFPYLEGAEGHR